jgi:hypothetical protein
MEQVCLKCQKTFDYPDWKCSKKPGNHVVEEKTYYHPGASDNPDVKQRRYFSPRITLLPSYESKNPHTGETIKTTECFAQFADGRFNTTDPEQIYYLDEKEFPTGEEGLALWRSIYLSPEKQADIARAELADTKRQIKENNELLAAEKAKRKVSVSAQV